MGKVSVNKSEWEQVVNTGSKSTENIKEFKTVNFSITDLNPFLEINDVIKDLNSSVNDLKKFDQEEKNKLLAAGGNKVKDDAQGASKFKK